MLPISICIIAKNEEKNMEKFLYSIKKHMKNYPYELIVVDTGSTDRTVAIAQKYNAKIFHFEWINDFSAARNYSISCASNDWILVLDCDEYIVDIDLRTFTAAAQQYPESVGIITRYNHFEQNGCDSVYTDQVERFFNRNLYEYEAIIHEQVVAKNRELYTEVEMDVVVDHSGYAASREDMEKKAKRNNDLLFQMLEKKPNDPYVLFQIAQSYNFLHDAENACYYYGKCLEYCTNPKLQYVKMAVVSYGYNLLDMERYEEALLFENIYEDFCNSADFLCIMGLIYMRTGNYLKAMQEFLKATACETCDVEGANSFIPTYNMATINLCLGDLETAKKLYKQCGDFPMALNMLAEIEAEEKKNS